MSRGNGRLAKHWLFQDDEVKVPFSVRETGAATPTKEEFHFLFGAFADVEVDKFPGVQGVNVKCDAKGDGNLKIIG